MYLERIEIVGFRGINRLSLLLDQNTVLIGENTWGKTSLFDALGLLFSPISPLYSFKNSDFYLSPNHETLSEKYLQILFTFCERQLDYRNRPSQKKLLPLWINNDDDLHRIYLRFEGELMEDGTVITWRNFLDRQGTPLKLNNINQLVEDIIHIYPVLHLRGAQFVRQMSPALSNLSIDIEGQLTQHLQRLSTELAKQPHHPITDQELKQSLLAMRKLFEHYFIVMHKTKDSGQLSQTERKEPILKTWLSLERLNQAITNSHNRNLRLIVLAIFSALLQARMPLAMSPYATPLLVIEDPETHLHPIMLSVAWRLLSYLPVQRITTTNSNELLSLVSIDNLCRLVRSVDRINSYRFRSRTMSTEDIRRIAFHIQFKRASSLFARCWLLVEGETEIWLLNELARLCGHHFETEGIKLIEFAQSGLKPLLKFARKMGIEWHVLVDGDEAGKKYASTVRSLLDRNYHDFERDRLTLLPARDMEFFMYNEGFSDVYHQVARIPFNVQIPTKRVIQKAIHRTNKPDLAIEVATAAAQRGVDAVPVLFKRMFSRILWLARNRAD